MLNVIEEDGKLYALHSSFKEVKNNNTSEWYGREFEPLQGSRMHYSNGKTFRTHRHKLNPRTIHHTQEAFVVIEGKISIDIVLPLDEADPEGSVIVYDEHKKPYYLLGTLIAEAGDVIFVYDGFHRLSVLADDSVFYEIKSGQFSTVQDDKIFIDIDMSNRDNF